MKITSVLFIIILFFFGTVLYAENTQPNPQNDMGNDGTVNLYSTPGDEDTVAASLAKDGILYYPDEGYLGPYEDIRDEIPSLRDIPRGSRSQLTVQSPILNTIRPTRPQVR